MNTSEMPLRLASITERLADLGDAKWAVHVEGRKRRKAGIDIIELSMGEPDMPPPPEVINAAVASLLANNTYYTGGRGIDRVLAAVALKYSTRTQRKITPENVLYFPGTQCALFATIMGLAEKGDEVIVGDPQYATYEGVIKASGADMVTVPLRPENGFHLRADDLEAVITSRSRVLLLNTPHNPTGATLTRAEIDEIVAVCEKHNLWIVSDEVYEGTVFECDFASPFDSEAGGRRTLVVSSISKSHMLPGFRAGWCVGPQDAISQILPLSEMMLFGAQPFLQDAAAIAIEGDFSECRAQHSALHARAIAVVEALDAAQGLRVRMPEGGMFVMIDVSGTGLDGDAYAWRLLDEENVAVMPGGSFGNMSKDFIRVSLGNDQALILEACRRMCALAGRLKPNAKASAHETG